MATRELRYGNTVVRVHDRSGLIDLPPDEQQALFDQWIADGDPIAVSIAEAVADINRLIEHGREGA